jgi:hypothetical protein
MDYLVLRPRVSSFLQSSLGQALWRTLRKLPPQDQFALLLLPAMNQDHIFRVLPDDKPVRAALQEMVSVIQGGERFYNAIG